LMGTEHAVLLRCVTLVLQRRYLPHRSVVVFAANWHQW
jgi:hypothetical protein